MDRKQQIKKIILKELHDKEIMEKVRLINERSHRPQSLVCSGRPLARTSVAVQPGVSDVRRPSPGGDAMDANCS